MTVSVNGTTGITFNDASTQNTAATGFGFKNRLINGQMTIDQRNAGASVTPNNSYTLDRWQALNSQTSKYTVQRDAGAVTPPVGFIDYLGCTSSSSYTLGADDYFVIRQGIEGLNMADLGWGTANASTVTLSFWVRSSLTGTFGGSIANNGETRSYPFSYTISAANTWEQKSVTIAGDTTGTWLTTTGAGAFLAFSIGTGTTYSGTAGAWVGSFELSATGATSVVGTSGATFYITGVQLEKGSTATSFDYRPYGTELALCQRYYWRATSGDSFTQFAVGFVTTSTGFSVMTQLPVQMRATPTMNFSTVTVRSAAGSTAITSLDNARNSTTQWGADMSATGAGLTAGQCCLVRGNASTSAYIDASAEL
jgi:hypothetical protein